MGSSGSSNFGSSWARGSRSKGFRSTSHCIARSTRKEAMRSVTLITLFAFVAQAHAEELAANDSMDEFADMLMDKLADKLFDFGPADYAQGTAYTPADDQLDEDELGE